MSPLEDRYRMLTAEWERIQRNGLIQTFPSGYSRPAVRVSRIKAILRELLSIERQLGRTPASRLKRRR